MWVDYSSSLPGNATLVTGDGMRWPFEAISSGSRYFNPPAGVHGQLYKTSTNSSSKAFRLTAPNKELYFFDDDGLLVEIRDQDGNSVIITRDNKYITTVADETGRELEFNYTDVNGNPNLKRISSVEAPDGKVWEFTYNSTVQMTEVKYPIINSVYPTEDFTYNNTHQILTHTDAEGDAWTYTYSSGNNKMLDTATNALGKTWDYNYFQSSAACTDPNSEIWTCFYTSGRITSSADPNGYVEYYAADAAENLTQLVDKRGKTWTWTYYHNAPDPWLRGNMLTATDPLSRTTTFSYNGNGNLIEAENALGQSATVTYYTTTNETHRPYQVKDASNVTQATFTYNSYGEVTRILSDQLGTKADSTYDSYGNVTQSDAISASNETISSTANYDIMGRVLTSTDPVGETKEFEYDGLGRLRKMYHEDDSYVQLTYDLVGRVISALNELGKTGSRTFNAAGYLTSTQNAEGDVQSYTYDNRGQLLTVTNGRGYTRTYAYSDRGDVLSLTKPEGILSTSIEQWTYDGNGNVATYTNELGQAIAYEYNNAGDQTKVDYPSGLTDTVFEYDGIGRLKKMTDATGISEWVFDTVGHVTELTTPQTDNDPIEYEYNVAGQLTKMTDPGVGETEYTYDDFGRPETLENPFEEVTTWEYDEFGRTFKQIFDDGMYQKYLYDSRSRLEKKESYHPINGILMRYQYWYNAASQVTHAYENAKDVYYTYDDIGQLMEEDHDTLNKDIDYTYDENGNRLTKSINGSSIEYYTYDRGDKLTAITGANARTFAYDAAGRTTQIDRGSGNVTDFTYDFEGRVTSITNPGSVVENYAYNGLDARVEQSGSSGSKTFRRAGVGVTSPLLSDGLAHYTPSISEKRGGTTTYSHSGLKNTNRQHKHGASTWSAARTFDSFGGDMASGWGTFDGPFGYGGQFGYQEDANGLKLLGHRYYDSSTGRFLSRDFIHSGRNWYVYCGNNPVGSIDPLGLQGDGVTTFVAGWGDALTLWGVPSIPGVIETPSWTDLIREACGVNDVVEKDSLPYAAGRVTGGIHGGLVTGGIGRQIPSTGKLFGWKFYPKNNGFASDPTPVKAVLPAGTRLQRFGGPHGRFTTDAGDTAETLSLPPWNGGTLTQLIVRKPVTAVSGRVAPYYGKPGGGTQHLLDKTIAELIHGGYLEVLP